VWVIFTARRYASAVYASSRVRLSSVRLSQAGIVWKRLDESAGLGGGFLPPIPDCVIRKYRYAQKLRTSLWDFVPNSGLQKSRHGKSIALSITLVVVVVVVDVPAC